MGTRADFYVGRTTEAEWLGSIARDGYPSGLEDPLLKAATEAEYRSRIGDMLAGRDDATPPDQGWPWPWDNSNTTDYAYAFDEGTVWASCFGSPWFPATAEPEDTSEMEGRKPAFPDMKDKKRVVLSGKRSGLIVIRACSDGSIELL